MPFLDNAIVDFARRLPPDLTRRGDQEKYVLSLLRGQLPGAVAQRRKQPLSAPDHRYFRGPLRAWARDVLLGAPAGGPLNRHAIGKRFDGWLDGSDYYIRRVRALVAFQLWWNLFFERPGSASP
jgi:asparagine synthase (glutamine-hydrolysing)